MAWVLQCDRCKQIFNEYNEGYRRVVIRYKKYDKDYPSKDIYKDLCPNCIKYIIDYLQEEKEE